MKRYGRVTLVLGVLSLVVGCSDTDDGTIVSSADGTSSASTPLPPSGGSEDPTTTTVEETTTTVEETTTTVEETTTTAVKAPGSASFAVPVAGQVLEVRDCYNVTVENVAEIVSCDEMHDGQAFKTDVVLADMEPTDPDADRWKWYTTVACGEDFYTFTDLSPGVISSRTVAAVLTSASGIPAVVSCAVVDSSGAKWAGTAESIAGSYFGIEVGDCFHFPTNVANALEVPCDQLHEGELYVLDTPMGIESPTAPFPTDDELYNLASAVCDEPFGAYTGVNIRDAKDLTYAFLYVREEDWADVDLRLMSCAVVNADGTHLTGSARS